MKFIYIVSLLILITGCATKNDIKKEISTNVIPKINDLNTSNNKEHKKINSKINSNSRFIRILNTQAIFNANKHYKFKIKQLEFDVKIDALVFSQELMKYNLISYIASSKSKTLEEEKKLEIWKENLKKSIVKKSKSYDNDLKIIREEIYSLDRKAENTRKNLKEELSKNRENIEKNSENIQRLEKDLESNQKIRNIYNINLTNITNKIEKINKIYLDIDSNNFFSDNNTINIEVSSKLLEIAYE